MLRLISVLIVIVLMAGSVSSFANPDAIVIPNGDLRIKGSGSGLVFPDGSIQYKATVEGPVGPQGPKGDTGAMGPQGPVGPQGPAAQITLSAICAAIIAENVSLPSFCQNTAPVANAGISRTVGVGATVYLDGTQSSDANGDVLTFSWSFTSKPAGSNATLSNATASKPTFTPDVIGNYVVELLVNDAKGGNSTSSVTITVVSVPPLLTVTILAGSSQYSGAVDGIGSDALFDSLYGITSDGANLYVADTFNFTIRKINISTRSVTTIAGSPNVGGSVDGVGTAARLGQVHGITTDGVNLYVCDMVSSTIRKINITSGLVTTIAGSPGGWGTADGTGSSAKFYFPNGIATDGTNLFVTDTYNMTIRKVVISSGVVTTLAGTGKTSGAIDGEGSVALFNNPNGITTDGANLYVADTENHTIRKIVISTGLVSTIAGSSGHPGSTDGIGSTARFYKPYGITYDGTYLYVADMYNSKIRKIELSSGAVSTVAATSFPAGITVVGDTIYTSNIGHIVTAIK